MSSKNLGNGQTRTERNAESARRMFEALERRKAEETRMTAGEHTMKYGGGTFDAATLRAIEPAKGYAVGTVVGTALTIPKVPGTIEMRAAITAGVEWVAETYGDAPYIGTWVDRGGNVHIDPVTIFTDRGAAILFAKTFRQQAIWDFENSEEIPV